MSVVVAVERLSTARQATTVDGESESDKREPNGPRYGAGVNEQPSEQPYRPVSGYQSPPTAHASDRTAAPHHSKLHTRPYTPISCRRRRRRKVSCRNSAAAVVNDDVTVQELSPHAYKILCVISTREYYKV